MKSGRIIFPILLTVFMTVAFTGCRSSKKSASSAQQYTPEVSVSTLDNDYRQMTAQYTPWTSVSVPVKISVTKPQRISLSGTMNMVYGKAIQVQLRMLFIDAATAYIDNDNIILISKPLGVYFSESLSDFTQAVGLDLRDIQSLLLGQAFVPGKGKATADDASAFTFKKSDEVADPDYYAWTLTPQSSLKGLDWYFTALASAKQGSATPQVCAMDINAGDNSIHCSWADSQLSQAGITAASMQIEGVVKKHQIDVTMTQTPSKASWNSGSAPSKPAIPSGCKRITTEQLLLMLNKL